MIRCSRLSAVPDDSKRCFAASVSTGCSGRARTHGGSRSQPFSTPRIAPPPCMARAAMANRHFRRMFGTHPSFWRAPRREAKTHWAIAARRHTARRGAWRSQRERSPAGQRPARAAAAGLGRAGAPRGCPARCAPARREALLAQLSAGDSERRQTLERLVAECEARLPLFDRPAVERFDQLLGEDDAFTLPALLGGRYRTGHEVGRGGMALVYLAHDIKHDRDVAIKVIRAELSATLGRDRFLREIAIAARLRHPNILPLYDSGEANGAVYFVMPFEEGPSLRERLAREGPLSITDALSVLRDVARALQYAHGQGVVHRDIKPDNILMSGGAAVVADFGIAKALSAAQTDDGDASMTQAGAGIGTPAYMAPEQAVGDPSTDHRADIYSFGCLAYELFTGKPPFHDLSTHQLIAAHVGIRAAAAARAASRRSRPRSICSSPDAWRRIPDCGRRVRRSSSRPLEHPGAARADRARSRPSAHRRGLDRDRLPPRSSVVLSWQRQRNAVGPPIRVAVLPFVNIAKDSAIELFADGLSDEIATALGRVPGIQIQSRSGARVYRGQLGVDVREAGRRLDADFVVTGAMRAVNGRWIITTELENVSSAAELWSEPFDRSPDAATGCRRRDRARTCGRAPSAISRRRWVSLRHWRRISERRTRKRTGSTCSGRSCCAAVDNDLKGSVDAFRQGRSRLDPRYAGAYSGLSMALALYPYFRGPRHGVLFDEVMATAKRALELDSTLAQPHVARGLAYQHNQQWDLAEDEYRVALGLDPDDAGSAHPVWPAPAVSRAHP